MAAARHYVSLTVLLVLFSAFSFLLVSAMESDVIGQRLAGKCLKCENDLVIDINGDGENSIVFTPCLHAFHRRCVESQSNDTLRSCNACGRRVNLAGLIDDGMARSLFDRYGSEGLGAVQDHVDNVYKGDSLSTASYVVKEKAYLLITSDSLVYEAVKRNLAILVALAMVNRDIPTLVVLADVFPHGLGKNYFHLYTEALGKVGTDYAILIGKCLEVRPQDVSDYAKSLLTEQKYYLFDRLFQVSDGLQRHQLKELAINANNPNAAFCNILVKPEISEGIKGNVGELIHLCPVGTDPFMELMHDVIKTGSKNSMDAIAKRVKIADHKVINELYKAADAVGTVDATVFVLSMDAASDAQEHSGRFQRYVVDKKGSHARAMIASEIITGKSVSKDVLDLMLRLAIGSEAHELTEALINLLDPSDVELTYLFKELVFKPQNFPQAALVITMLAKRGVQPSFF